MGKLGTYLDQMAAIRSSGEASDETSYYPALSTLLNGVGNDLRPRVHCVLTPKNRGAGIPDGGLFLWRSDLDDSGDASVATRTPERGVIEVKGLDADVGAVAGTAQVRRYLEHYGKVLVTNYRDFLPMRLDGNGDAVAGEPYSLAASGTDFWALPGTTTSDEDAFTEYLARILTADAPLSRPEDVAAVLAAYARIARQRLEAASASATLDNLRAALEDALGVTFEGERGRNFFHAALIQTLFYGVFAAWVVWSKLPAPSGQGFSWRMAQWTLNVPMVRVLFEQLATPRNLPAGLDEVLDWAEEALGRIEQDQFLERFESSEAIQYFYEPFLQAYDPGLRRQLGVWFTPPEVVRYMVARVDEALREDLGVPLGLADERVHVLDPATGTGSFLVEVVRTIAETLESRHGDALVGQDVKKIALERVHGFELLPAPLVVAHLQLGLLFNDLGAPLDPGSGERASVYLTNSLTGWGDQEETLPRVIEEFAAEREAAGSVKRDKPIWVVLGNPPYNGYAGVSGGEEMQLLEPYKEGLAAPPWEITKNKLDDYYVRFFRIAEHRIAERTGEGIVCFISNFGWLGDPSAVVMRKHLISAFDRIYIDNLNGDSRETGKKTPDGEPDPSVFATSLGGGIQVGTAVSLLVRNSSHSTNEISVSYRDFWGATKRSQLDESLVQPAGAPAYEPLSPGVGNWFRLRRWEPRPGYESWPSVVELAADKPKLGLNENRGESVVSVDREVLIDRMRHFLDEDLETADLDEERVAGLLRPWADYDAVETRRRLLDGSPYNEERVMRMQVRPFDLRWAYVDPTPKLWNRPRPEYVRSARIGSDFLLVRRRAPRALDGAAFLLSRHLIDQHTLHKDAYTIPVLLAVHESEPDAEERLFAIDDGATDARAWQANLSQFARDYLDRLGITGVDRSRDEASLIWLHALAIGYSPLYLEENGDAIRNDWPRIPLPETAAALEESAGIGSRIAALLDLESSLPGLDSTPGEHLSHVAAIARTDGSALAPGDLEITAGWGSVQVRTQRSGAESRAVMPGEGRTTRRSRSSAERRGMTARDVDLLGDEVIDAYLNDDALWRAIPAAAWNYKIGGFQVLRKWLSYRESAVLGRALSLQEAREFSSIARRLVELVRLEPELDTNYRQTIGAVVQDELPSIQVEHQTPDPAQRR